MCACCFDRRHVCAEARVPNDYLKTPVWCSGRSIYRIFDLCLKSENKKLHQSRGMLTINECNICCAPSGPSGSVLATLGGRSGRAGSWFVAVDMQRKTTTSNSEMISHVAPSKALHRTLKENSISSVIKRHICRASNLINMCQLLWRGLGGLIIDVKTMQMSCGGELEQSNR